MVMLELALALLAPHFPLRPFPPIPAGSTTQGRAQAQSEDDFYVIETFAPPADLALEVSGLAFLPGGDALIATRRGEVYRVSRVANLDPAAAAFERVLDGLSEPLGLLVHDGWVYTAQRGELSRFRDAEGDAHIDEIETVCDAWQISGNYHEYNFGPRLDADGNFWITTNKPFGDQPFGAVNWRGFALRITPEGEMQPVACGLRSPAGIEISPAGEAFYTDNQGEWCGASKLAHLEPGDFHGHPHGLASCSEERWPFESVPAPPNRVTLPRARELHPTLKLPAVWFPYDKMGKSPAGFAWDETGGAFGPFTGQVFVGDQHHAAVMRVFLERVNGHWQGACFPFRSGLQCGIVRVAFGPDGTLYTGQTNRGWGSKGSQPFGLERLRFTGEVPFEILSMAARKDGFVLTFTLPVGESAADPASYHMESYTYLLHEDYGSPEVERAEPKIERAEVLADGLSVRLFVSGLRSGGFVHELHSAGVLSRAGRPLLHSDAYYTLVELPE